MTTTKPTTKPTPTIALVETMPKQYREDYAQCRPLSKSGIHGDCGTYPLNGATREWMTIEDAEELVEADPTWTRIVETQALEVLIASGDDGKDECGVRDHAGGTWWPNEETQAEIRGASDPEMAALRICAEQPMRGTWSS